MKSLVVVYNVVSVFVLFVFTYFDLFFFAIILAYAYLKHIKL